MLHVCGALRILTAVAIAAMPSLAAAQPGVVTTVSATASGSYTFVWNRAPGATYYYLWVNEGSTPKYTVWHTAAQANCGGTQPTCAVTVTLPPVAYGDHNWWVQAYNLQGYGPWSAARKWTSRPPSPYVIDANGKFVGLLLTDGTVLLYVNGEPARAGVLPTGFSIGGVQLLYTQAACAGQAYGFAGLPDRVFFTGSLAGGYLTRGATFTATVLSFRNLNPDGTIGSCSSTNSVIVLAPVAQVNMTTQLGGFVAPFKMIP